MRKRIFKISIALNVLFVLFVAVFATAYFHRRFLGRILVLDKYYERRKSFFHRFPVAPGDVVFLGDSITDECRWCELFPEARVRNRGILDDTTSLVLNRLDQVTAGKPAKVFLLIGTNDLGARTPEEEIVRNYRCILAAFKEKSPGTQVFVQSVLPRSAKYKERVEALNAELFVLAKHFGYVYIDLYPEFLGCDGSIDNQYSFDELHLNGAGYKKWRKLITPYVY